MILKENMPGVNCCYSNKRNFHMHLTDRRTVSVLLLLLML